MSKLYDSGAKLLAAKSGVAPSVATIESLSGSLGNTGIVLCVGPFLCRLRCKLPQLSEPLFTLYQDYSLNRTISDGSVCDFDVEISQIKKRFWSASEVEFQWKGYPPLPALPISQTHPLFEWGLNWCIATLLGTEIVIHAAVVEKNGIAVVLPGEPGAGKSTLCAALVLSGWRLFSDELTVIPIQSELAMPIPRPISLKDASIELIAKRYPDAQLTTPITETRKGEIAYVRPPTEAIRRWKETVPIRYFLFPLFQKGLGLSAEPMSRAACLAKLMASTFNVGLLGHEGFSALANVVAGASAYSFEYGDLDSALEWIDRNCL